MPSREALSRVVLNGIAERVDEKMLAGGTRANDALTKAMSVYGPAEQTKADGRTIFLSSHILSEVEKTCDRVAIIRDGRLVRDDRVEALRDLAHHQVELRFDGAPPVAAFEGLPGVSEFGLYLEPVEG